jgi:hypothetical protein
MNSLAELSQVLTATDSSQVNPITTLHGPRRKQSLVLKRRIYWFLLLRAFASAEMCLPSRCLAMGIPVTISTHVHLVNDATSKLEKTVLNLLEHDFTYICRLLDVKKWSDTFVSNQIYSTITEHLNPLTITLNRPLYFYFLFSYILSKNSGILFLSFVNFTNTISVSNCIHLFLTMLNDYMGLQRKIWIGLEAAVSNFNPVSLKT